MSLGNKVVIFFFKKKKMAPNPNGKNVLTSPGNERLNNVQEREISPGSSKNGLENGLKCRNSTDRKSTNVSSTITSLGSII